MRVPNITLYSENNKRVSCNSVNSNYNLVKSPLKGCMGHLIKIKVTKHSHDWYIKPLSLQPVGSKDVANQYIKIRARLKFNSQEIKHWLFRK